MGKSQDTSFFQYQKCGTLDHGHIFLFHSILFKLTSGEMLLAFGQLFPRSLSEDVAQFVLLEKCLFHSVSVYNRACKCKI
ncbi:hypothetical protein WN944_006804 [Citrus x changshan-huyou]|uniref:Uncharacterized protein n=1 Tax=Citrus x changshan-huyou TaxID=2935761 RepID=A0AAP0MPZ3_9ROSI